MKNSGDSLEHWKPGLRPVAASEAPSTLSQDRRSTRGVCTLHRVPSQGDEVLSRLPVQARNVSQMGYFDGVAKRRGVYEVYSERKYAAILEVTGITDFPQGNVLELGCGSGAFAKRLNQRGFVVVGLDISRWLLLAGQRSLGSHSVAFAQASVAQLPMKNHSFDVVFCADVLHHVPDMLDATFAEARRVLKPDGVLAFYEPNARHLRTKLLYKLGFAATKTEMALDPRSLEHKLRRNGFAIERLSPFTIAEDSPLSLQQLNVEFHEFVATVRMDNVLHCVWKLVRYAAFVVVTHLYDAIGFARLFRKLDSLTQGEYIAILARAVEVPVASSANSGNQSAL